MTDLDTSALEATIGITFHNPSFLRQAIIHRSYLHETDDPTILSNERLEFLGDACLGLIVAEYLYQQHPEMSEGELTTLRAAVVRASTLSQFAQRLHLGEFLWLSHGEEMTGGRQRGINLARAFEAVIGAIYLDQGMETARQFVLRFVAPILATAHQAQAHKDHKSQLQELVQGRGDPTPHYQVIRTEGPDHARQFFVEVLIGDQVAGRGSGRSKREAEQNAAQDALSQLPYIHTGNRQSPHNVV